MQTGSGTRGVWSRMWRVIKIVFVVFVLLFVAGVIWRMPIVAEQDRSAKVAQEIRNSHITMADVDGSHLPPAPDPALVDATVEGIDANHNGIRDDVELAIFNKYPGTENLKIRAAELQYARGKQFFLENVFSSETLVAAINQDARGYSCIGQVITSPDTTATDDVWQQYDDQIKLWRTETANLVTNTKERQSKLEQVFAKYMTSYGLEDGQVCDLDLK